MALISEARIYNDLLDLAEKVFMVTSGMNKQYRNPIGRRMEDAVMGMADNLLLANFSDYREKVRYLLLATVCYERLQFAMNAGVKLKCISFRQQAQVSLILSGIGKQMTGLRKYAERKLREKENGLQLPKGEQ